MAAPSPVGLSGRSAAPSPATPSPAPFPPHPSLSSSSSHTPMLQSSPATPGSEWMGINFSPLKREGTGAGATPSGAGTPSPALGLTKAHVFAHTRLALRSSGTASTPSLALASPLQSSPPPLLNSSPSASSPLGLTTASSPLDLTASGADDPVSSLLTLVSTPTLPNRASAFRAATAAVAGGAMMMPPASLGSPLASPVHSNPAPQHAIDSPLLARAGLSRGSAGLALSPSLVSGGGLTPVGPFADAKKLVGASPLPYASVVPHASTPSQLSSGPQAISSANATPVSSTSGGSLPPSRTGSGAMRTVFQINSGARTHSHSHSQSRAHTNASRSEAPTSNSKRTSSSCRKLGFEEATRTQAAGLGKKFTIGGPSPSASASSAVKEEAKEQPSAVVAVSASAASPKHATRHSANGSEGKEPALSASELLSPPTLGFYPALSLPSPSVAFRAEATPSPFMPASSPSPVVGGEMDSSMVAPAGPLGSLQLQGGSQASGASQSQSPFHSVVGLFSPETSSNSTAPSPLHSVSDEAKQGSVGVVGGGAGGGVPQFTTTPPSEGQLAQPQPLPIGTSTAAAVVPVSKDAQQQQQQQGSGNKKREAAASTPRPERHSSRIQAAEAKAAAAAAAAAALSPPTVSPAPTPGVSLSSCRGCNCKKSRCLKLYCECFARQGYCSSDCKCVGCQNVEGAAHRSEREKAIAQTLERDPRAFFRSADHLLAESGAGVAGSIKSHPKGCHCKKSSCQKKYCECFQAGLQCTDACKCVECKNGKAHTHTHDDEDDGRAAATGSGNKRKATISAAKSKAPPSKKPATASTKAANAESQAQAQTQTNTALAAQAAAATCVAELHHINSLYKRHSAQQSAAQSSKRRGAQSTSPSTSDSSPAVGDQSDLPSPASARSRTDRSEADMSPLPTSLPSSCSTSVSGPGSGSGSGSASSVGSAPVHQHTAALGLRASAPAPTGTPAPLTGLVLNGQSLSHRLTLNGVGGLSFQAQLAAHQQRKQKLASYGHGSRDPLETDSDYTASAENSLQELAGSLGAPLHTPVKLMSSSGVKRPSSSLDASSSSSNGVGALHALAEVASPGPSPRMHRAGFGTGARLMSPVSPLSVGPMGHTPNSKRQRMLTYNGGSPLPPLFSPGRFNAPSPGAGSSPFPRGLSSSPAPGGGVMGTVLGGGLGMGHHGVSPSPPTMSSMTMIHAPFPRVPSPFLPPPSLLHSHHTLLTRALQSPSPTPSSFTHTSVMHAHTTATDGGGEAVRNGTDVNMQSAQPTLSA